MEASTSPINRNLTTKPVSVPKDSQVLIDKNGIFYLADGRKLRISKMTVEGMTIDFKNLDLSDTEFKAKVENEVVKILSQFSEKDHLKKGEGAYKLSLFDNKAVLKAGDDEKIISHSDDSTDSKPAKYEKAIASIESSGLKILAKKEEIEVIKHTFTKKPMGLALAVSIRVAALAAAILFSPLILTTFAVVNAGIYTYRAIKNGSILKEASRLTRSTEENKWDAMEKTYRAQIHNSTASPEKIAKAFFDHNHFYTDKEKLTVLQNKTDRYLIRAYKKTDQDFKEATALKLRTHLTLDDFRDVETLKTKIRTVAPELKHILKDAQIEELYEESKAAHIDSIKEDQDKLFSLMKAFENPGNDVTAANLKITEKLRGVIESPTYQALKMEPDNEYIKLVHKLSVAIWNKPTVLPAYQKFGEEVLENIDSYKELNDEPIDGPQMATIINDSHHYLESKLYTDHGVLGKMIYAFTHPKTSLIAASSEGGILREVSGTFGYSSFDPLGIANNNPSLQGTTTASIKDGNNTIHARINNCYGGSPTIVSRTEIKISPEYLALCQAAENNQFAKVKDKDIPSKIYYTSLQDIENTGHGDDERSFRLMELNNVYPLSFVGMTLAKDSNFYMMRGEFSNPPWISVVDYGNQVFKQFESEKCYHYGDRTSGVSGHGMYLPGGAKKWEPILAAIKARTNARFEEIARQNPGIEPNKLRGAYQEYVYSMIEAYTEMEIAQQVAKEIGNNEPLIMTMKLCKGNLDRGGAENAKNYYTRLPLDLNNGDLASTVLGSFEGRAISVCDRIILPDRLTQVVNFIELVGRKEFKDDLLNLFKDPKTHIAITAAPTFTPAF